MTHKIDQEPPPVEMDPDGDHKSELAAYHEEWFKQMEDRHGDWKRSRKPPIQ